MIRSPALPINHLAADDRIPARFTGKGDPAGKDKINEKGKFTRRKIH